MPSISADESMTDGTGSDSIDWQAILEAPDDSSAYVRLTPERVAILCLEDCAHQLNQSSLDLDRLALAAKALHLALQAALTAALAGSASIGAHPPKLRSKYIQYFEDSRAGPAARPENDRVMGFEDLLAAATGAPLPWTQEPLEISDENLALLDRLSTIRHAVEHPKQSHHSIEAFYIAETFPVAADLTATLLATVVHHLEPGCLDKVREVTSHITAVSSASWTPAP